MEKSKFQVLQDFVDWENMDAFYTSFSEIDGFLMQDCVPLEDADEIEKLIIDTEFRVITEDEYQSLKDDSMRLRALQSSGVDNWSWYGEAMKSYREMRDER